MPEYLVRVTYTYPVSATDAKNALSTVPMVIKVRIACLHGKGTTEILDSKGKVVLRAELNTKN